MPVFHTKTIEAILEPVAQQVSQLVILHEEAEDGSALPDLSRPIQAVGVAVANLVKVGKDTAASSKDKILKQEMPLAFTRVEESSLLLIDASKLLKDDPYSPVARHKLIDGARGILSGTSALLLTFDEAEVRKILALCKGVLEYLAIVEVVESMEDLVEFVKNLTPGMREMAKSVEAREKELTHQVHRDMLKKSINTVKELTPLLISAVKAYVSAKASKRGVAESQENRNYIIGRMSAEISEIMRVLQLTTYEEDGSDDPLNDMKKAASVFSAKFGKAKDWLRTPAESAGGLGERAVRDCILEGRRIADLSQDPDKGRIRQVCDNLDRLMGDLADLRRMGKGTTPEAQSLAREVASQLDGLQQEIDHAMQRQGVSGVKKPFNTFVGKMEQAQTWLNNPGGDHSGLGERAIRECVLEGRRVADQCSGRERMEILQLCDELDQLCDELAELKRRGMGNSPQAQAVARKIERVLDELNRKLQKAAVEQVVDDFMDTTTALKQLEKAARAPLGTPNREEDFEEKAGAFEHTANQTANTAIMLANTGGNTNKRLLDDIKNTATEVKELTPQVSHSAKILLLNPDSEAASGHFDAMKKEWQGKVERITELVDSATDTSAFLEASEEAIKRDAEALDAAMAQQNAPLIAAKSSNIARRAKRVAIVAQAEADNSEDPEYVHKLNASTQALEQTISPLIIDAKAVATNLKDKDSQKKLKNSTRRLQDAVHEVRKVVITSLPPTEEEEFPPPPPDISAMHISQQEQAPPPPRPPPPSDSAPPPRPPPPVEEELVDERAQLVLEQPPEDNPMALAAHQLHKEALKWEEQGNDIIQAAKKMAVLFAQMSKFMSEEEEGTPHSKKELIALAKQIANESKEVVKHASKVARQCSDKRLRQVMEQTIERIPTISTQLKIVATVKATMIGANDPKADMEATETLVGCAENLMSAVRQTVRETEAASVKMRHDAGTVLRWRKK